MTDMNYQTEIVATLDQIAVRDGAAFRAYLRFSIPVSSSKYVLIKTPTNKDVIFHSRRIKVRGSTVDFFVYTGSTITNDGTESTKKFNLNSMSSRVTTARFYTDPTVTAEGTEIDVDLFAGGDQSQVSSGGFSVEDFERVLPRGVQFLSKFTNTNNTNTAVVIYELIWQEIN